LSIEPCAIGLGEMALRVVARPGAWFGLIVPAPEVTREASHLVEEIKLLDEMEARRIDAGAGAADLTRQAREVGPAVLVIAGFEDFSDAGWRHLDLLRSELVRDEPIVLVLSKRSIDRLMRCAPNLASFLGGAVWTLDSAAELLTEGDKESRLATLRAWSGLSDAEMVARVERGDLPLEPEHAEWLVLLGRGDLLVAG
jgi:hypothetical protein